MDIGTPERYLQASWDILEGGVATRVRPTAPGLLVGAGAKIDDGRERRSARRRLRRLPDRRRGRGGRFGPARGLCVGETPGSAARSSARGHGRAGRACSSTPWSGRDERAPAYATDDRRRPRPARPVARRALADGNGAAGARRSRRADDLRDGRLGDRRRPCRRRARRPADQAAGPIRGYELPSWATPEWAVLCSSYSGNTEETLACFEAAEVLGARRFVVSTGGPLVERAREAGVPVVGLPGIYQPRVAVAYMFVGAAEVAALAGAAPRMRTEIDTAAAFLDASREEIKAKATEIAAQLGDAITVVYGSDLTAPVARRWKTQINENAKLPAFYSELPEADHNEICGWSAGSGEGIGRGLPRRLRPAPAGAAPLRAHRRRRSRRRRHRWCDRDRGRDPGRAPALGDDARRPGLA